MWPWFNIEDLGASDMQKFYHYISINLAPTSFLMNLDSLLRPREVTSTNWISGSHNRNQTWDPPNTSLILLLSYRRLGASLVEIRKLVPSLHCSFCSFSLFWQNKAMILLEKSAQPSFQVWQTRISSYVTWLYVSLAIRDVLQCLIWWYCYKKWTEQHSFSLWCCSDDQDELYRARMAKVKP